MLERTAVEAGVEQKISIPFMFGEKKNKRMKSDYAERSS